MAAPLTWRNVDAPDFRGSLAGLGVASGAFDRAFQGLDRSLDKWDHARKEVAESALLNNAFGISDPKLLQAAVADGSVFQGIDRNLVGRQALGLLDKRVGSLLDQANSAHTLETAKQIDPLRITQAGLTIDKTRQGIAFDEAANPKRLNAMDLQAAQTRTSIASSQLGMADRRQSMGERAAEAGAAKLGAAALLDLHNSVLPGDTAGAAAFMQSPRVKELPTKAQLMLHQAVEKMTPGLYTPESGRSGGGGASGSPQASAAPSGPASQAQAEIGLATAQGNANTLTPVFKAAMEDNSSLGDVVVKLQKGVLKDLPPGRIVSELQSVMQARGPNGEAPGTITPALAAAILERNLEGAGMIRRNLPTLLGGYTVVPNQNGVQKDVALVQQGVPHKAAQQNEAMKASAAKIGAAQTAFDAAMAKVKEAERRGMDTLPRYRAEAEMARAVLLQRLAEQQSDPSLQPQFIEPANASTPTRRFPSRDR